MPQWRLTSPKLFHLSFLRSHPRNRLWVLRGNRGGGSPRSPSMLGGQHLCYLERDPQSVVPEAGWTVPFCGSDDSQTGTSRLSSSLLSRGLGPRRLLESLGSLFLWVRGQRKWEKGVVQAGEAWISVATGTENRKCYIGRETPAEVIDWVSLMFS